MNKPIRESLLPISIYKFKEWGYLNEAYTAGNIYWADAMGYKKDVLFEINLSDKFFKLKYKVRPFGSGEEYQEIEEKYKITSTPCNYGGKRYWFICPMTSNGKHCGKRVANLYIGSGSNYFACRHCYNMTYSSRNDSLNYALPDYEKQEEKIKRYYYNGKPTRKYKRLLKIEESIDNSFIKSYYRLRRWNNSKK
jgi:hypothetical protein